MEVFLNVAIRLHFQSKNICFIFIVKNSSVNKFYSVLISYSYVAHYHISLPISLHLEKPWLTANNNDWMIIHIMRLKSHWLSETKIFWWKNEELVHFGAKFNFCLITALWNFLKWSVIQQKPCGLTHKFQIFLKVIWQNLVHTPPNGKILDRLLYANKYVLATT